MTKLTERSLIDHGVLTELPAGNSRQEGKGREGNRKGRDVVETSHQSSLSYPREVANG